MSRITFAPIIKDGVLYGNRAEMPLKKNLIADLFFGTRHSSWENIPNFFPNLKFARLKQTHSNEVVSGAHAATTEADAHFTSEIGLALTIVTADCLPVLLINELSGTVAAIHAGWRGIATGIVPKTLDLEYFQNGSSTSAFIGPHIQKNSFEVGLDVAEKIIGNLKVAATAPHLDPKKCYIDLNQIAHDQILSMGVPKENIQSLGINTYTDPNYSSYRKKESPVGRQISFVALRLRR